MALKLNRAEKVAAILLALAVMVALCSGCAGQHASIEQHGNGTAEVKEQQGVLVIDEVADKIAAQIEGRIDAKIEAKLEARAGTQEKTDNSTAGRDKTQADVQQGGLLNLSWTDVGAGGIGISVLLAFTILLYAMRKQNERTERARADREWAETERDWLQENARLRMAGKELLPMEYKPVAPPEPCRRGWWPFTQCRKAA